MADPHWQRKSGFILLMVVWFWMGQQRMGQLMGQQRMGEFMVQMVIVLLLDSARLGTTPHCNIQLLRTHKKESKVSTP